MDRASDRTYLPYIDGLRGLSVLAILLFHLQIGFLPGGFFGVDVFFVISGYLITTLILKELSAGTFSLRNFYARRVKRLFPALFSMLFLTSCAAVVLLSPEEYAAYFKAMRYASVGLSNFLFSQDTPYFSVSHDQSPLLHTWSLGVEEQFYLIWSIFLVLSYRLFRLRHLFVFLALISCLSLAASEYLIHVNATHAFYLLQSRAWELALGGLLSLDILPRLPSRRWAAFASLVGLLVVISSFLFLDNSNVPGLKALAPCLGAALFIYSAQHGTQAAHRLLSSRMPVSIGLISYSLYLWHFPLIAFYKLYFGHDLGIAAKLCIAAVSFALAYTSYRYIEMPIRRATFSPTRVIVTGATLALLFVVASNVLKQERYASWRVDYRVDEAELHVDPVNQICGAEGGAFDTRQCIIGPHKNHYEVILAGDSHAAHYIPAVLGWAKSRGLTVRIFLRWACPTWIRSSKVRIRNGKPDIYCERVTDQFYSLVAEKHSIKYVLLGLWLAKDTPDAQRSLEELKRYRKDIYFLGDVPQYKEDPNECRFKNNLVMARWLPRGHKDCLTLEPAYYLPIDKAAHDSFLPLLRRLDIPYFDPLPIMKTPFDEDGHFMYMDDNHLNRYGGLYLEPYFEKFMTDHTASTSTR